jgi:conjugative transfer region lipoprotein (TIGR03751 family)
MQQLAVAALISLALAAAGCASHKKEDILPQDGPTMKEVYDGHFNHAGVAAKEAASASPTRPSRGAADGAGGGLAEPALAVNGQFPRLPNPDLAIYVFPHLSDKGYPVPGYTTVVPMYQTVEYALPGETEGW